MKHEFVVENIKGRALKADNCLVSINMKATTGDDVTLNMDPRIVAELIDSLATLNDEAMKKKIPNEPGMRASAYRNLRDVTANTDAMGKAVLIDIDPGTPHRLGVAIPVEHAEAFAKMLMEAARRARVLGERSSVSKM